MLRKARRLDGGAERVAARHALFDVAEDLQIARGEILKLAPPVPMPRGRDRTQDGNPIIQLAKRNSHALRRFDTAIEERVIVGHLLS